jgi:hypothetical protein
METGTRKAMAASIAPPDDVEAIAGLEGEPHIADPLILISAVSLSGVPFVEEIVAVNVQPEPEAFA